MKKQIRVLYISSKKSWRGVTSWMVITALGLEQKGHRVSVLSHPDSEINPGLPKQIHLIEKKLGPSYNPAMIGYLIRFIRRHKIDILISNIDKEVAIGGIAARLTGIIHVRRVGREDDFNTRFRSRYCHKLLVDKSIVPCYTLIDNALRRAPWLDRQQFKVIYNGRNIRQFSRNEIDEEKQRLGLQHSQKILGITAQLSRKKQVGSLIDAYADIHRDYPDWVLVITGSGPEQQNLKNLAGSLGISDKVIFAGFAADPMVACSIYDIAFSVSRIEGFPNTVVEYMACGKPVISTDVGGVSEIIRNGENGFLVPYGDRGMLLNRMRQLMNSHDLRLQFSKSAQNTIREGFTEDQMIAEIEKYLSDLINTKPHQE